MVNIDPFANETETLMIGDLTVENRTDMVSIYGSLDITQDRAGLKNAYRLWALMAGIIDKLGSIDLSKP